ncbi:MAG TPA: right-handed parallel beta-helix repeat-containing protein, partial [Candidatus Acetothermia bacterium]|nr:right-handed parallel beta-helix repeat-containing protein [Candidatus Acetothermia bacterium]
MPKPLSVGALLRWVAIAGMACLPATPLGCSRPAQHTAVPCTIKVRAGEPLQEALDRASPGAVVCLGAGTWEENVRVTKPVTLCGEGPKRTILRSAGLAEPVIAVGPLSEPGEVVISGITCTGAAGSCADPTGCAHGLLIRGDARVSVYDCTFSENVADGIQVRDAARVALNGVKSVGNGSYGLRVREGGEVTGIDSSLVGNRTGGIWLSDRSRLDLVRSEVTGSDRMGLWIRDEATVTGKGIRVSDNGSHGIWAQGQARVSLSESAISANADTGLVLEGGGRVTLIGCRIERAWDGIYAGGTTQLRVEGGTIADSRWDGIRVGGSARAEIVGCTIRGGGGSGVCVVGSAEVEVRDSRIESWPIGVLSLAVLPLRGEGNDMAANGVDLVGNVPGTLRTPRLAPSVSEARFPDPQY